MSRFPVPFQAPAFACWASCPTGGFRFLHSRPTRTHDVPGPQPGFTRSPRMRYDRGGCPLYAEAVVSAQPQIHPPAGTAASQRLGPIPHHHIPPAGLYMTTHQSRV
jgi:energy-converting hydrogenase Eha subunit F